MDRFRPNQQTKLYNNKSWSSLPIHRNVSRTRASHANNNSAHYHHPKRNRHNKYIYAISKFTAITTLCSIISPNIALAADVGGVSATANPIANSSGSVTNQAIQVLQGPYITNTYGNAISCQGPTMNVTPYANGSVAFKKPFEDYYDDPEYNIHDADDDGQIDNPGDILYYMPTRTGQKDSYNVSLGLSATWSKPLDKELQALCKQAATTQIGLQQQLTANKRLDFEIARLKNCGELMKAGIMFHPRSPYYSVCADVVLINTPGVVPPHNHKITQPNLSSSNSSDSSSQNLSPVVPSSPDTHSSSTQPESDDKGFFQGFFGLFQKPASPEGSQPSGADLLGVLQVGQMSSPPQQSLPSSPQPEQKEDTAQ